MVRGLLGHQHLPCSRWLGLADAHSLADFIPVLACPGVLHISSWRTGSPSFPRRSLGWAGDPGGLGIPFIIYSFIHLSIIDLFFIILLISTIYLFIYYYFLLSIYIYLFISFIFYCYYLLSIYIYFFIPLFVILPICLFNYLSISIHSFICFLSLFFSFTFNFFIHFFIYLFIYSSVCLIYSYIC